MSVHLLCRYSACTDAPDYRNFVYAKNPFTNLVEYIFCNSDLEVEIHIQILKFGFKVLFETGCKVHWYLKHDDKPRQ